MTELTIMCGLPGSGKSTYANDHFDYVVCPDTISKEFGVTFGNPEIEKQVWNIAYRNLRTAIELELPQVCFDTYNTHQKARQTLISIGQEYGIIVHCIHLATPFGECIRRNSLRADPVPIAVIERMYGDTQDPEEGEGFNSVITIVQY